MADVGPFEAIRYNFDRLGGDVADVIAPPYDVLNQADKDRLLARSDHNIVAIDLPHIPPKSLGPAEVYEQSAKMLSTWLDDQILVREESPAFYLYHQIFEHGGQKYTRRKFICKVRLQAFSDGVILPHEETFGGPKEDRLALTKACKANLSPVFGIYTDPGDAIGKAFAGAGTRAPDAAANVDGVENRLWIVTDAATVEDVVKIMSDKRLFIADGHHRYGTALNYRDQIAKDKGRLEANDPVNFVMMVLGSMDDPGSLILPYNRVLVGAGASTDRLAEAWSAGCEVCDAGAADLVLHDGAQGSERPLRFINREHLKTLEPSKSSAWHSLDAAYVHRYLLDELSKGLDVTVRYVKSADAARSTAKSENGVALLVNATQMAQLRDVSEAGELMPQKSTYFYPKLATGFAINPLS